MAGLSKTQIDTLITKINTELNAIVDDPNANVNYAIGDKRVDKAGKVEWLMKMLDKFTDLLKKIPAESVDSVEFEVNEFGKDVSDYVGEDYFT